MRYQGQSRLRFGALEFVITLGGSQADSSGTFQPIAVLDAYRFEKETFKTELQAYLTADEIAGLRILLEAAEKTLRVETI